ncbi:MAG: hypothetical protein PHD05_08920 [Sphaerochaetaceae bacterium]|nr:hypothetical protein [Sphaerochaetaceae bacterium]
MEKLIRIKIKHLPKDQQDMLLKFIQQNPETNHGLKASELSNEVNELFEQIIAEIKNKKSALEKLLKDYKKDLNVLKDKQELILVEEKIEIQMKE